MLTGTTDEACTGCQDSRQEYVADPPAHVFYRAGLHKAAAKTVVRWLDTQSPVCIAAVVNAARSRIEPVLGSLNHCSQWPEQSPAVRASYYVLPLPLFLLYM